MPIDISEFEIPKLVRYKTRYPLVEDRKAPYMKYTDYPRNYRGASGFPMPGYNPNHGLTKPERVKLDNDDITLLPR